jgi:hypothetical protein
MAPAASEIVSLTLYKKKFQTKFATQEDENLAHDKKQGTSLSYISFGNTFALTMFLTRIHHIFSSLTRTCSLPVRVATPPPKVFSFMKKIQNYL